MPRPRKPASPFRYFNSSPEVIRLAVLLYVKYSLSLRKVKQSDGRHSWVELRSQSSSLVGDWYEVGVANVRFGWKTDLFFQRTVSHTGHSSAMRSPTKRLILSPISLMR